MQVLFTSLVQQIFKLFNGQIYFLFYVPVIVLVVNCAWTSHLQAIATVQTSLYLLVSDKYTKALIISFDVEKYWHLFQQLVVSFHITFGLSRWIARFHRKSVWRVAFYIFVVLVVWKACPNDSRLYQATRELGCLPNAFKFGFWHMWIQTYRFKVLIVLTG